MTLLSDFYKHTVTVFNKEESPHHWKDSLIWECIQKFLDWLPGVRTANSTALCHYLQLYRYFVSFAAITLYVASHQMFYCCCYCLFCYESVWKLLHMPSYLFIKQEMNRL